MALTKIGTDGIKDDAITKSKIPANQIEASELADNAVDTNAIADQAVALSKLPHGTSSNDGKFLRANNGADPTFETVNTTPEGTAILSTGESGGTKFLREDGDGSCSWQTVDTTPADDSVTQAKLNFPITNRNLIINGAMDIAQRTTSAVNAPSSGPHYETADRWLTWANSADKFSTQRVENAPSGFKYSLKVTSNGANANESYQTVGQRIESQNLKHLNLGTAYASTMTLSFWVRSSETGTFTGYIHGTNSFQPSYVFTYTISTQNTWEHKKITIAAATVGGASKFGSGGAERGLEIGFTMSGAGYVASAANTWEDTGFKLEASGVTNVDITAVNGATWYVTGVQLEAGSTATEFDHRPVSEEERLCERYYVKDSFGGIRNAINSNSDRIPIHHFRTKMRASPTVTGTAFTEFSAGTSRSISGFHQVYASGGGYAQLSSSPSNGVYVYIDLEAEL